MTIKPPLFIFFRPVRHNRIGLLVSCLLSFVLSHTHLVAIYRATTDETLRDFFSAHNQQILDSIVMRDRETGRSRGFGFVTYANPDDATAAIEGLNDKELDGRRIKVNLANARGGGGGGGGGGYSSGGGGNYSGGGGAYSGGGGGGYGQTGYAQPGYSQGSGYGQTGGGYSGGGYGGGCGRASHGSHGSMSCVFVISLIAIFL